MDFAAVFDVSAAGMDFERMRLEATAANLANAQTSGTFTFQNTTISFAKVGGQTNITIFDGTTTTQISVPTP